MTLSCGILVLASADKLVEIALLESTIDTLQRVYIRQLKTPPEVPVQESTEDEDGGCDVRVVIS